MLAAVVLAQLCTVVPAGGVVVTEGRGGHGAVIAAHSGGVVVGWQETGPRPSGYQGGPPEWRPRVAYSRELDGATMAPRGAASEVAREEEFYAHMTGLAAAPSGAGDGAGIAWCQCFGGTGNIACESRSFGNFPTVGARHSGGGCSDGTALGTAGAGSAFAFTDSAMVSLVGSRSGREHGTRDGLTADRMAIARADGDRAVLVWRTGLFGETANNVEIGAMTLDNDARPSSQPVVLGGAPDRVGAPAVAWVNGSALVTYARAATATAPWQLALATWTPGRRHTAATLATGRAPAMAPSIVASRTTGCAVVSWTEGRGRGTVVGAGRVCNGALDRATVGQVSQAGVEAGDSELATDGRHVYVVWQEIPSGRGVREELRVGRLACE